MDIPGVGAKSVQKLLKVFGSVKGVREASEDRLRDSVGVAMAKKLRKYFDTSDDQTETSVSQTETANP
ncbi:MAG: hypothetical protein IIB09_07895 [Bacteroidetes bacterium]|nr:hypothetical protein [Bacteroidota bacterium]